MENLKNLIKSVEQQSESLVRKINMVNRATKTDGYLISSSDGCHQVKFTGERQNKIRALIESFIKEDDKLREPSLDKLNTLSRLIGNGE